LSPTRLTSEEGVMLEPQGSSSTTRVHADDVTRHLVVSKAVCRASTTLKALCGETSQQRAGGLVK
jgi:hypothetical protein